MTNNKPLGWTKKTITPSPREGEQKHTVWGTYFSGSAFLLSAFMAFTLIFSVLTLLFWSVVSDTILIPIYYCLWVLGLLINSVPQGAYLALLSILSIAIGVKTLQGVKPRQHHRRVTHNQPTSNTRYLHWHIMCTHALGNWFSKGQLAFEVRNLILSILAFEQGVNLLEAEEMVRKGLLDLPDVLRNVVETKSIPNPPPNRLTGILFWLRNPARRADARPDPFVEQLLSELINFVEDHLEITTHARNTSES